MSEPHADPAADTPDKQPVPSPTTDSSGGSGASAAKATGQHVSEEEARNVAEASREQEWTHPSFMKEVFLGRYRFELLHPFPSTKKGSADFPAWFETFQAFMRDEVDSVEIDATGEYPDHVIKRLAELGAFGMKIPKEYGGLGFSQAQYDRVMQYLGSCDGNIGVLLSAHQSIGVPQPVKMFGSEELKQEYLPKIAKGAITAFALTEPGVGSDPARLTTTVTPSEDGEHYILNGTKLWCTNGTIADYLVVMARDPSLPNKRKQISAVVVNCDWDGVKVEHRSRFMGLKALANGVVSFTNVKVPKKNLIGKAGDGLKYALITLNTGRLSLPANSVGSAKASLNAVRYWGNERVQWGQPVGSHEAIAVKTAEMAATTFAMEAVSELASTMADHQNYDIRLEAAATKDWNTARAWDLIDDAMQIRGGRGYETEQSLKNRGEAPVPVERIMRDIRINRIIEGSSEVMHLFMAREAVDTHLKVAEILIKPDVPWWKKLGAMPRIGFWYAKFYAAKFFRWGRYPNYSEFGELSTHLRFCDRTARKLAKHMVWGMALYRAAMQTKQGFLFRAVDVGTEIWAMSAAMSKALKMKAEHHPQAHKAIELTDLFCRSARRRIATLFRDLWKNDDERGKRVAREIFAGDHTWLESNIQDFPRDLPAVAIPEAAKHTIENAKEQQKEAGATPVSATNGATSSPTKPAAANVPAGNATTASGEQPVSTKS